MSPSRRAWAAGLLALLLPLSALAQPAIPAPISPEQAREELAYTAGLQAFLYGFPAVEMYRIRHRALYDPANPARAPVNTFQHRRALADASMRTVVAPNNDTLYSSAWLDVSREPVVLEVPDTAGRYYVMQLMDFHTNNVGYVGKRATGTGAGRFAIVGPGWRGTLPAGLRRLDLPTPQGWLLGRTLVDGPDDLPAVHALQDRYHLTPLSAWLHQDAPPPAPAPPPYDPREPLAFFHVLNQALRDNPPPPQDAGLLGLLAPIGDAADRPFRVEALDPATAAGLRRALETGPRLLDALPTGVPAANGWTSVAPHTGRFGTDYRYRASVARWGIASNNPEEATNFTRRVDDQGRPLHGSRRYRLRFEAGQLPPVDGFWSLSMYGLPGGFFVENPLQRFAVGDRSRRLHYDADGSLELLVQHDPPPPDQQGNWLPAPAGDFELALRCYLPRPALVERRWLPPPLRMLGAGALVAAPPTTP